MTQLKRNSLFNPNGDTDLRLRRMIGGNTTNLNDFNNMKYQWASDWYRQAMNNFWIPEEINLTQDTKDYPRLDKAERTAYDRYCSCSACGEPPAVIAARLKTNGSCRAKYNLMSPFSSGVIFFTQCSV